MLKGFKGILKILVVVIVATFIFACNNNEDEKDSITEEMLKALEFKDGTFGYDGEEHSITIENIYEDKGVEIAYANNNKVNPGKYTVTATITYEELKVTKKATLRIEKAESVLEAPATQTFNASCETVKIQYSLNNESQKVITMLDDKGNAITVDKLVKPGVYNIEIYVKENQYYKESNHVKITVTIIESQFDITFESKKEIADGTEKKIEIEGTLPSGYTVEYENNTGTVDGNYYATATIKDSSDKVVETHRAVLIIDNPENEAFQQYLDEFFVEYLEGDQLSVNIFCENPEDFGLEHYDAEWYSYESFGAEEIAHDLQIFKDYLAELEEFKDAKLNDLQESAYETVRKFLQHNIDYYSIEDVFFMEVTYVDQFGGYVADFGTYMEAYSLRTEEEVKDVVSYIESTKTAFPSYLSFVEDKKEKGYPLSDFTITEMRGYLEELLADADNYYLVDFINAKIDNVDFLTDEAKASYKEQVTNGFEDCFFVGVQDLYDGLEQYLGALAKADEGYLKTYENGKTLYELELKKLLGYTEIDFDAYIDELDSELNKAVKKIISAQNTLFSEFNLNSWGELDAVLKKNSIYEGTPEEMVEYLKEFAKTVVPELKTNPNIAIKEMDEASGEVSNAVAYYMKSALDNTSSENITLNPVKLENSTSNDVLGTLAHEGYPGHLYAYVYSKEAGLSNLATIMTSTAHAEGWATYIELKLYDYAKANSDNKGFQAVMNYLYANQLSGFLLETRLDAGIHYQGWGVQEVASYMSEVGYGSGAAQEIHDLLIEMPSQYAAYGYGKLTFMKLHNEAQRILGAYYDEIEFNAMLLSKGWTDLEILEETYDNYMRIKCHECGIVYE